jgi:hypothetical protein
VKREDVHREELYKYEGGREEARKNYKRFSQDNPSKNRTCYLRNTRTGR